MLPRNGVIGTQRRLLRIIDTINLLPTQPPSVPSSTSIHISSIHPTTSHLQLNLPHSSTSNTITQLPVSYSHKMNSSNTLPPLLQMPMRGTKLAPVTFKGKYSKVTCFIQLLRMRFGSGRVMRSGTDECQKRDRRRTRTWLQLLSCALVAHDVLIWKAESDRRRGGNQS